MPCLPSFSVAWDGNWWQWIVFTFNYRFNFVAAELTIIPILQLNPESFVPAVVYFSFNIRIYLFSKLRDFEIQDFFSLWTFFYTFLRPFLAILAQVYTRHTCTVCSTESRQIILCGGKKCRLNVSDKQNVLRTKRSRSWRSAAGKIMSRHCFSVINNGIPTRWKRTSLGLKMKTKR